jgi:hypothetical protein
MQGGRYRQQDHAQAVYGRESRNCPIPPQERVGDEATDKRSDIARSLPICNIGRCGCIPLVQNIRQVHDQIGGNAIVRKTFAAFVH